MKCEL